MNLKCISKCENTSNHFYKYVLKKLVHILYYVSTYHVIHRHQVFLKSTSSRGQIMEEFGLFFVHFTVTLNKVIQISIHFI